MGSAEAAAFAPSPQLEALLDAKKEDGSAWVGTEAREYFDALPDRAKEWLDEAIEGELVSEPSQLSGILSLRLQTGELELLLQDNCALCHSDPAIQDPETLFSVDPEAAGSPAHLDLREVVADVHFRSGLSCAGCHGGAPSDEDMADEIYDRWPADRTEDRSWIPGFCARCHADTAFMRGFDPSLPTDQYAKYETSRHGVRLLVEHDSKAAQCLSCHGVHGIRSANSPKSKVHPRQMPYTCGECHADAAYMAGYRIADGEALPTDQLAEFEQSVHGRALLEKGDLGSPACNDCHGNHAALPPETASIAQVCRNCHSSQGEWFDGSKHKAAFEREGWPECTQCHGNHAIREARDAMLSEASSPLCYECHSEFARENPECSETARHFHASLTKLAGEVRTFEAEVAHLAELGLDPDPLASTVDSLHETLREARARIHSFDRSEFDRVVARGEEATVQGNALIEEAEEEYRFRLQGLSLSVATMALLAVLLALKIREIDRRDR